jgi:hypothetical protein
MTFFQIEMNGSHSSQSGPMENPKLLEKIVQAQIFSKKSDIEIGKIRGSKPDDIAVTQRKGPFSGYKTLKL